MKLMSRVFLKLAYEEKLNWIPTPTYLKMYYYAVFGKKLNLSNPKTFNEKLQWIKVYDHNPIYSLMVDKYEAKQYVSDVIGKQYIIPNYGVWNDPCDIDFDSLPQKFVLKTTHDSGGVVIVDKGSGFNKNEVISFLTKRQKRSLYNITREWPYKNVKPRVIAEQFMVDTEANDLWDYKFYVFDGKVKMLFIAQNRGKGTTRIDYFDEKYNHLDLIWGYPNADSIPPKPAQLDKMIELAEKLAIGIPEVRVDFYLVNGRIYFGEMTFFDGSGFTKMEPMEWDTKLGDMIKLGK